MTILNVQSAKASSGSSLTTHELVQILAKANGFTETKEGEGWYLDPASP